MADLDDINDLMAFLDIEGEDAATLSDAKHVPMPELRRIGSTAQTPPPVKAHNISDQIALMRLAVENDVSLQERMKDIDTSLSRNIQHVVHYRLPTELVLSHL